MVRAIPFSILSVLYVACMLSLAFVPDNNRGSAGAVADAEIALAK